MEKKFIKIKFFLLLSYTLFTFVISCMLAFVGVSNFLQEKIQLIRPKEEYEMKKKRRDGYKK
jgi:hypothetical protein